MSFTARFKARFNPVIRGLLLCGGLLLLPQSVWATFVAITEDDPGGSGALVVRTYTTRTNFVNNNAASTHFVGSNLFGSGVSVGGLAHDGTRFIVLLESDPGGLGNINLAYFDTFDDLINWNVSGSTFLGLNIWGSGVSAVSLAHDGSQYLLTLESDPGGLGNLNIARFDTFDDLRMFNVSGSNFLGQNIFGSGVSVAGLTFDGTEYLRLTESDPGGLGNVVLARYASYVDLVNSNVSGSNFLGQNPFGTGVSIRGLAYVDDDEPPPPVAVPAPGAGWLLVSLLALLSADRLRGRWPNR